MKQYSPVAEILRTAFTDLKLRTLGNVKIVMYWFYSDDL